MNPIHSTTPNLFPSCSGAGEGLILCGASEVPIKQGYRQSALSEVIGKFPKLGGVAHYL